MANLTSLRKDVGKALRECVTGYVDAVTDTTIQDNDLIDPIEAESLYTGAWLYIISGNGSTVEGHILRYNPSSGLLTLSRPLLPTPEVSDEYEIHTLIRPTILNELIQEAVSPLYYEGGLEYGIYNHPDQLFWGVPFTDAPGHVLSVVNRATYTGDVTEAEEYPVIWNGPFRNEAGNAVLRIELNRVVLAAAQHVRVSALLHTVVVPTAEDILVCVRADPIQSSAPDKGLSRRFDAVVPSADDDAPMCVAHDRVPFTSRHQRRIPIHPVWKCCGPPAAHGGAGSRSAVERMAADQPGRLGVRFDPQRAPATDLDLQRLAIGGAEEVRARCRARVATQPPEGV